MKGMLVVINLGFSEGMSVCYNCINQIVMYNTIVFTHLSILFYVLHINLCPNYVNLMNVLRKIRHQNWSSKQEVIFYSKAVCLHTICTRPYNPRSFRLKSFLYQMKLTLFLGLSHTQVACLPSWQILLFTNIPNFWKTAS